MPKLGIEGCRHRLKLDETKGGSEAVVAKTGDQNLKRVAAVGLTQNFDNGMCAYLTMLDIGPVRCNHPDSNQDNCPEIKTEEE